MDGIRVHVHESKLNACRRNVNGDRKDGGHRAEGKQGHIEVLQSLLLLVMVLGFFVFMCFCDSETQSPPHQNIKRIHRVGKADNKTLGHDI